MSAQQPFRSASLDDRLIAEAGAGNTAEVQQLLHEELTWKLKICTVRRRCFGSATGSSRHCEAAVGAGR